MFFNLIDGGKGKPMKEILCRIGLATLVVTVFALLTPVDKHAHAAGQGQAGTSVTVKIDNFSFGPAALTVPVGTTVTWTNQDDIPHTVVSTDGVFKSKALDTDDKFSFVFSKPGTYSYFCSIHPKMTGQVIVQ
jgi:plastocyanin